VEARLTPPEPILEVRNLTVSFATPGGLMRRRTIDAVDDLSLTVMRGESLGLVGESGSGKTTLSRAIVKLTRPSSGTIRFDGGDVYEQSRASAKAYRRRVQMIFQDPYESLNPRSSVKQAVEEPMVIHGIIKERWQREQKVSELLQTVGLSPESVLMKYPHELSGGERQRVSLARALSLSPDLLIADEPVSMLDVSVRIGVLNLMLDLKRLFNLTCLFITHDLGVARYFCDRIAVMYHGRIVEMGDSESLLRHPLHPYTKLLIDSVPGRSSRSAIDRAEPELGGQATDGPVAGCSFNPRCPYAQAVCRERSPPLLDSGGGRLVACHFPLGGRTATTGPAPEAGGEGPRVETDSPPL
jgi:oligopeptide/dipeptide ABC transporter ATP-binding protein